MLLRRLCYGVFERCTGGLKGLVRDERCLRTCLRLCLCCCDDAGDDREMHGCATDVWSLHVFRAWRVLFLWILSICRRLYCVQSICYLLIHCVINLGPHMHIHGVESVSQATYSSSSSSELSSTIPLAGAGAMAI